jgi:co-chaperonin GroES (HSP10)
MKLTPLRDNIVVLQDETRDDIAAGIVIAASAGIVDSQRQFGRRGTVIAVGADVDRAQLKPGDRILYGEFAYPEYIEGYTRYIRMSEKDVVGVIE